MLLLFLLINGYSFSQPPGLKQQARAIISKLKSNFEYPLDAKDTLIDLNRDGYKDLLIEYYGLAGTGLKNRVIVYLYDNSRKNFRHCGQVSNLANPTFFLDKKMVAGYYVANGGGGATKLRWKGLRLDTLEYIEIDVINKGSETRFELIVFNYLTKKRTYQALNMMQLPKEYNYLRYEPIIRRNRL
jgi:hypothetical protein